MRDVSDEDEGDIEEERPWNLLDFDPPLAAPESLSPLFVWPTSDCERECIELMAETQALLEAAGLTAKDQVPPPKPAEKTVDLSRYDPMPGPHCHSPCLSAAAFSSGYRDENEEWSGAMETE